MEYELTMKTIIAKIFGEETANDKDIVAFYNDVQKIAMEEYAEEYHQSKLKLLNDNRNFGMVRWHSNVDDDVACVSIDKAKEYVEKYNKLSGKEDCYVDEDVYLLLTDT